MQISVVTLACLLFVDVVYGAGCHLISDMFFVLFFLICLLAVRRNATSVCEDEVTSSHPEGPDGSRGDLP